MADKQTGKTMLLQGLKTPMGPGLHASGYHPQLELSLLLEWTDPSPALGGGVVLEAGGLH